MSRFSLRRAIVPALALLAAGAACALAFASTRVSADETVTFGTSTIVLPTPTVASSISTSATNVLVGTPFTLTVSIQDSNVGAPSATEDVTGFDFSKLTLQSGQSDFGACTTSGTQVQCPLGPISPGNLLGVTLVVLPTAPGTFQFTGKSTAFGGTPGSVTVTVAAPNADLAVRVPAATLKPKVGHTARAGITVTNNGPVAVTAATLALTLPPDTKLVSAVAPSGNCVGRPLVCHLGGLGSGSSDLVVVTLSATKPGTGRLVATASAELPDTVSANNSGSLTVSVPRPPKPHKR